MTRLAWTFIAALGLINLAALFAFGIDKWKAKRAVWRVPEATLALFGLLGGWPGALLAMRLFRHKTQKRSFQAKLAAATLGNLLLWYAAWHFGLLAEIFRAPTGS